MWTLWALTAAASAPNVILISMDTVRADAVSCYGVPPGPYRYDPRTTPNLDAFAAEGARFERFFAHAPSTLSSHSSMMTGLDPHGHAVVRNGFPLDPEIPTLAERLSSQGWDTIAVVGSAALEASMGLDRGFRVYDDHVRPLNVSGAGAATDVPATDFQAPADDVVRRVFAALDGRADRDQPLFLFAHFYDAHAPYAPPPEFATRFADPTYRGSARADGAVFRELTQLARRGKLPPDDAEKIASLYLGEVGFVDQQVGVLLHGLEQRGLLEHTLVVVVADHGETLSDEPLYSWSHGSNVGYEVMHVPLLMRGYGVPIASHAVVERQAGMSGLARTIERLVGLEPTLGTGLDFADLVLPGPVRDEDGWPERATIPVFVEATRPRQAEAKDGWNNENMHRGVFAGGWAGFFAPFIPVGWTWYGPSRAGTPSLADTLQELVRRWDDRAPPHRDMTTAPDTRKALKALGYVE
jgi:arylsulfatase A-like enzyme